MFLDSTLWELSIDVSFALFVPFLKKNIFWPKISAEKITQIFKNS